MKKEAESLRALFSKSLNSRAKQFILDCIKDGGFARLSEHSMGDGYESAVRMYNGKGTKISYGLLVSVSEMEAAAFNKLKRMHVSASVFAVTEGGVVIGDIPSESVAFYKPLPQDDSARYKVKPTVVESIEVKVGKKESKKAAITRDKDEEEISEEVKRLSLTLRSYVGDRTGVRETELLKFL